MASPMTDSWEKPRQQSPTTDDDPDYEPEYEVSFDGETFQTWNPVAAQEPAAAAYMTKGVDHYIYDSDEDGNDKTDQPYPKPQIRCWPIEEVRKCARSEFVVPGTTWDSFPFSALPPVKSAEIQLWSHTQQASFSSVSFNRVIRKPSTAEKPQRLSKYLAGEVAIQLSDCSNFDMYWHEAKDMEAYIRRVIWPQVMQIDAIRLTKGFGSDTVALAKVIPPPRAAGFDNGCFWGCSVYMALRFPPGSHPFTTPVVRNAIAHFRRCLIDRRDPWGSDPTVLGTRMALAASWAGYHIGHHLITRNAYGLTPEQVQSQRQEFDTLVWLATRAHASVKRLFEEVLLKKDNVDWMAPTEKLHTDMIDARWDRLVGTCHRVAYNWQDSLPLPLCKPSRVFGEMVAALPPGNPYRSWEQRTPFTEFDEPLDPRVHCLKACELDLVGNVLEKITRVNKWLLAFLREDPQLAEAKNPTFSYVPVSWETEEGRLDGQQHRVDRHVPGAPDISPESADAALPVLPAVSASEVSELKASVARIELAMAVMTEKMASQEATLDIICQELAGQDSDTMAQTLAPALAELLKPALVAMLKPSLSSAEASLKSGSKDTAKKTIAQIRDLIGPLSHKLDNIEARIKSGFENSPRPGVQTRSAKPPVVVKRTHLDSDDALLMDYIPSQASRNVVESMGPRASTTTMATPAPTVTASSMATPLATPTMAPVASMNLDRGDQEQRQIQTPIVLQKRPASEDLLLRQTEKKRRPSLV